MNFWGDVTRAFRETNHDAVSVASGIGAALNGGGKLYGSFKTASADGVFDAATIDGGASAVADVGAGVVAAAAPEAAIAAATGAVFGYGADFVDHLGQNLGWWGN
ncbi:hypothetical protein [Alicyclobacillus tolerans]|uniref:Uncharacterized protein n=1 Tax=Alicyclobacillus tolerans TaxID=90970 RepID=A0A1M6XRB0_9BACL|nr:hypothetical protein [Alicyclobacillus montanus]SHL08389.1 hypothetical protein SAMN05443507_13617 [Alicyclobacillus montanus]